MKPTERMFVVGRKTAKGTTVVFVGRQAPKPLILGPWTVRAVVSPAAN